MDFTLKWAFNLANYQSFRYVKQFYEIRAEIRQYSSETISKKLISIWGCRTASPSTGIAVQITATPIAAEPGCGGSRAPVPGSTLWSSSLSHRCAPPHTPCSRTARSPPLKQVFYSQLAKLNNFTKPEFSSQEETFPECSRILWPQLGTAWQSPAALSLAEVTPLLSPSMGESTMGLPAPNSPLKSCS